jgi:hypothetical protein
VRLPALRTVEAEAKSLLPIVQQMLPIRYRVRRLFAVEKIDNGLAQIWFDDGADGGPCIEIALSREGLIGTRSQWRYRVFTRLIHEFLHARTADDYEKVLLSISKNYEKSLMELWDSCAMSAETLVLFALQNGMKI